MTSEKRSLCLLCLALVIITVAVYWQAGGHEFLSYDDNQYVTENPHVSSGLTVANIAWAFTSVHASNWHPITWLSHMVDVELFGLAPRGHHLSNVFIHASTAALILFVLYRLTSSLWQSCFVAALFALHPLHVESVAWIAERKDVLSAFFWFLTILFYAEYVASRRPQFYALAFISFALGLMAKPMLVTLPVVLLLLDFWPLNRYSSPGQQPAQPRQAYYQQLQMVSLKEKIPFIVCSIISSAITIHAQNKGGSLNTFEQLPADIRIINAITSYVKYIMKTLWPVDLAAIYPFDFSIPIWQFMCSLIVLVLITVLTVRSFVDNTYLLVGWLWFVVTLIPVIGIVQVGRQSIADRYTYIPLTGIFIMIAWGVPVLTSKLRYRQSIHALLAGAVLMVSTVLTAQQIQYWHDSITLFQHATQVTSRNYIAHNNIGTALIKNKDLYGAIEHLQEAISINTNYADAHFNLGNALVQKGVSEAAFAEYLKALSINPRLYQAHNNVGTFLAEKGDWDGAIVHFKEALMLDPNYYEAHYNLGNALERKGDLDAAIIQFYEVLRINPDFYWAHNNLGTVLAKKGDLDAAIDQFRKAIMKNPNYYEAIYNVKNTLAQKIIRAENRN